MLQDVPTVRKKTTLSFPPPPETTPAPFYAPTTFKILPLAKWKPVSIGEEGALRLIEDEDLFKEFLTTMFNSKEVNEYKDLLNYFVVNKSNDLETDPNQRTSKVPETNIGKYGQLPKEHFGSMTGEVLEKFTRDDYVKVNKKKEENVMSKEMHEELDTRDENGLHELAVDHAKGDRFDSDTEKQKRFTVFNVKMTDPEEQNDEVIEKNIVDLIDKIDLSDTNEKSSSSGASEEGVQGNLRTKSEALEKSNEVGEELGITQLDINFVTKHPTRQSAQKQDSNEVFTLLYISKNKKSNINSLENIEHNIKDFDDNISEGLPIDAAAFKDLTFRSNITKINKTNSILDFLSRNELYDLLSEAIDEVTKYKETGKRLLGFFILPNTYLTI